jgi:hypothetical protein
MTAVRTSVSAVDTMASHFRKINQRLASLERASSSGGGGGGVPSDWTPYDARFVNVPGDAMNGPLTIGPVSPASNELLALKAPAATYAYVGFYQSVTRRGWVGAHFTNGDMYLSADTGLAIIQASAAGGSVDLRAIASDGVINMRAGSALQMTVSPTVVRIPTNVLELGVPSDFWASPGSQTALFFPSGSSGLGNICSNGSYRLGFYSNGYRTAAGWTNFNVAGLTGSAALEVDPQGLIIMRAQATAPSSAAGPAEVARVVPQALLIGKTGYNTWTTAPGHEFWQANGQYLTTMDTASVNIWCNHVGAADANAVGFIRFTRGGATLSNIVQATTVGITISNCTTTPPSHGPFKGNIIELADDGALDRVMLWRPVSYQWRYDDDGELDERAEPSGDVHHGFVAQELNEVAPHAVVPGRGTEDEHRAWRELAGRYIAANDAAAKWDQARELDPDADIGERPIVPDDPGDDPFAMWQINPDEMLADLAAAVQRLTRTVRAQAEDIAQLRAQLAA